MLAKSRIGVDADDFRLPIKDSLRRAAELDFGAVEFATVEGELAPANLSASGRRHLARYLKGLGLELSALVADMPGVTLTDPRRADERVARTSRIIDELVGDAWGRGDFGQPPRVAIFDDTQRRIVVRGRVIGRASAPGIVFSRAAILLECAGSPDMLTAAHRLQRPYGRRNGCLDGWLHRLRRFDYLSGFQADLRLPGAGGGTCRP